MTTINHPLLSEMRRVILGAVNPNPSDPFGSQRNDFLAFNGNTEIFVRAFELAEYNQALYDLIESYYHSNSMEGCKSVFNEIEKEVSFHNGGTYNLRTKKISPKNLDETLSTMGDITSDKDIEDAFRMKASLEARPHEAHFEALFGSKSPRNQRILFDMAKTMEPGKLLLGALYSYRTNGNHDRLDLIERILVEMGSKADKYLWMLSDIEQDLSKEMIDDVIKRLEVEQAPKSKGERMDGKLGQIAKKTIEPITSHPKSSTGANSYCLFCKQFYPTSKPIADFKCVHCSPTEKESSALPKPATHPENCFTCGKKTNFYGYSFNEHPSNYMCEECKGFSREDPEFVLEQFHYRDFPYRPGHIWYNGKQFHNGKSWFLECEKCGILDPKPMKWFERVMVSFGRGFNREQPPFAPFTPKPGQIWNGYASCFEVKELRVAKQAEEDRLVLEKERKEIRALQDKERRAFISTHPDGFYWVKFEGSEAQIAKFKMGFWTLFGLGSLSWDCGKIDVLAGPIYPAPPRQPEDDIVDPETCLHPSTYKGFCEMCGTKQHWKTNPHPMTVNEL
jgi:hypothetical protein